MNNNSEINLNIAEKQRAEKLSFTELENRCVMQCIQNKGPVNIGIELGLSESAVRFYLMNAAQKLRLIAKAKR